MISAACVVWISLIVPTFGLGYYGQPSGALWADQLFVATSGNVLPGSKCGSVYRGTLRRDEHMPRSPIEYWDHSAVAPLVRCPQTKLEVRENRVLWYTAGGEPLIMPFTELPCLEANNFGDELCRLRHGFPHPRWLISKYTGSVDLMLFPEHRKPDVPEPPIPVDPNTAQSAAATRTKRQLDYRYRARTDLQIAGPKSVRLFHAYASFIYISVEPDYLDEWRLDPKTKQLAKNLPPPPNRQLRTGKLPADFTERFAAYTSAKRDYLVTPNGKVYMAAPKGKAEVEVSTIWVDPKRPIVGVVQDLANDAVYAWGFVTDSAAPERFYVRLDPKPVAVAYKRTVPLWGDRSDAYLESYECTRAVRKAMEKK